METLEKVGGGAEDLLRQRVRDKSGGLGALEAPGVKAFCRQNGLSAKACAAPAPATPIPGEDTPVGGPQSTSKNGFLFWQLPLLMLPAPNP